LQAFIIVLSAIELLLQNVPGPTHVLDLRAIIECLPLLRGNVVLQLVDTIDGEFLEFLGFCTGLLEVIDIMFQGLALLDQLLGPSDDHLMLFVHLGEFSVLLPDIGFHLIVAVDLLVDTLFQLVLLLNVTVQVLHQPLPLHILIVDLTVQPLDLDLHLTLLLDHLIRLLLRLIVLLLDPLQIHLDLFLTIIVILNTLLKSRLLSNQHLILSLTLLAIGLKLTIMHQTIPILFSQGLSGSHCEHWKSWPATYLVPSEVPP
jgi:hypothetical protein